MIQWGFINNYNKIIIIKILIWGYLYSADYCGSIIAQNTISWKHTAIYCVI